MENGSPQMASFNDVDFQPISTDVWSEFTFWMSGICVLRTSVATGPISHLRPVVRHMVPHRLRTTAFSRGLQKRSSSGRQRDGALVIHMFRQGGPGATVVDSEWPRSRSGAMRSRTRRLRWASSGNPPSVERDHSVSPSRRTVKMPPVPGSSATSPSSDWKVVSSSCAIHAARSSQRQRVQYSISSRGALLVTSASIAGMPTDPATALGDRRTTVPRRSCRGRRAPAWGRTRGAASSTADSSAAAARPAPRTPGGRAALIRRSTRSHEPVRPG